MVATKAPLFLSRSAASEVVHGPPLGACAVRDARLEVLTRRLKWLALVANLPGLVGTVHRFLATTSGSTWTEPSAVLASALAEMKWTVARNLASPRSPHWPHVGPETSYCGRIFLEPQEDTAPLHAVWTDGSVGTSGGAAAFQLTTDKSLLCHVPAPRSSTQCELVAITLAAQFRPPPPLILSDSLCALRLVQSCGRHAASPAMLLPSPTCSWL